MRLASPNVGDYARTAEPALRCAHDARCSGRIRIGFRFRRALHEGGSARGAGGGVGVARPPLTGLHPCDI
jgi:hypothetical protein